MSHCEFDHSLYFPRGRVVVHHLCDVGALPKEEADEVSLLGKLDEVFKMGLIVGVGFNVEDFAVLPDMVWELFEGGGVNALKTWNLGAQ